MNTNRTRSLAAAALVATLALAAPAFAQQRDTRPQPGETDQPTMRYLPDLVVLGIVFDSNTKVRVRVQNKGKGRAAGCTVSLAGAGKSWTMAVPPLAAGAGYSNVIDIAPSSAVDSSFLATVDSARVVTESDENNNKAGNNSKVIH